MSDVKNQIQLSFSESLSEKLLSVQDALPSGFNQQRFVQNCLSVMNEHPEYKKYGANELITGCMKAAYLGLSLSMKEAYLIPYGNKLQFQTDYKGDLKFTKAYSTRPIKDIYAKVVRKGDDFIEKIVEGHPTIDFNPLPFNGGDIVGAFAVCLFEDGGMLYETMSIQDIQSVRNNYSSAKNSKAWQCSLDEMCKKTVLRRLTKHIDKNIDSVEAIKAFEEGSGMTFEKPQPSDIVADPFAEQEEIIVESVDVTEPDGSLDDELPF